MAADNHVGPYRILRLINQGGQGSVYLGYDKRLHRRVAIKIYSLPGGRAARKRLLREAQLVAGIQSPKVVQIHDVIESSEHIALVMEYVPGCDLEEFLASARPSLGSVLTIGADIAGALAVARQQRVVHGDLKAGNILITGSGRAKLTDFGISRCIGDDPSKSMMAGSLSAVSPEQYLGKPLDVRSDLFALACLLYRMLSGEQPFFSNGQLDPRLLLAGAPRPLEDQVPGDVLLPEPLAQLIGDMLQKEPDNRPANTHRVRQVLRSVARDMPMAATNSLAREARPYFRSESADELPPLIPTGLGREGRSRLALGGRSGLRARLAWLSWPARSALALVVAVLICVPLALILQGRETPVRFGKPILSVKADVDLPAEVSSSWLVNEVKQTLNEQLGVIRVVGPVGATRSTVLYASPPPERAEPEPEEELQIALHCVEGFCVFGITRAHAADRSNAQGMLFPGMSVQQWRDVIRSTTRGLYR